MSKRDWQAELIEAVKDFTEEELQTIQADFAEVAGETRDLVRAKSPKRTDDYANSWYVAKAAGTRGQTLYTVANKDHWQLTHLLERGHQIVNAYGKYGRTKARRHIKPAEEWGVNELLKRLKKDL